MIHPKENQTQQNQIHISWDIQYGQVLFLTEISSPSNILLILKVAKRHVWMMCKYDLKIKKECCQGDCVIIMTH